MTAALLPAHHIGLHRFSATLLEPQHLCVMTVHVLPDLWDVLPAALSITACPGMPLHMQRAEEAAVEAAAAAGNLPPLRGARRSGSERSPAAATGALLPVVFVVSRGFCLLLLLLAWLLVVTLLMRAMPGCLPAQPPAASWPHT